MAINSHFAVKPHTLDRILIKTSHITMAICILLFVLFIAMQLVIEAKAHPTELQAYVTTEYLPYNNLTTSVLLHDLTAELSSKNV